MNDRSNVPALGDRDSIVAFLRREYRSGPWEGTQVFLILADAIERKVDIQVESVPSFSGTAKRMDP